MRRALMPGALVLSLLIGGCGSEHRDHVDVVSTVHLSLRSPGSAPVAEPAPAVGVIMLGASEWVTAGATGSGQGSAVIERTVDAGRRYATTFSSSRAQLWWIGRDGSRLVAVGYSFRGYARDGRQIDERPLILFSGDRGTSWTAIHPTVPRAVNWQGLQQFAFSGRGAALAVPQAILGPTPWGVGFPDGVLRSGDDGRTWTVARLPGRGIADASATWTPDGRTAYVVGDRGKQGYGCGLWRSVDAGAHWRLHRGECGFGVAFVSPRDGFLGAGDDPKYTSGQYVLATSDGGARWHKAWSTDAQYGEPAIVQLVFSNRDNGWALVGGLSEGANVPWVGDVLVTHDGGKRWRDTGQPATALSAGSADDAVAVLANIKAGPELALTRDGGTRWTELTPLRDVETNELVGGTGWLTDLTDAGAFLSTDEGASWQPLDPPQFGIHSSPVAVQPELTATLDAGHQRCGLLLSNDGGQSWRTVAPPGRTLRRIATGDGGGGTISCDPESFAFADPQYGFAVEDVDGESCSTEPSDALVTVYRTSDGGVHWRAGPAVPIIGEAGVTISASASLYVALGESDGVNGSCSRIAISHDHGRSWSVQAFPAGQNCSGATAHGNEVWVTCSRGRSSTVYRSADAGATWHAYTSASAFSPSEIVATGRGHSVASAAGPGAPAPDASLLETTDGGAVWTRVWPSLPTGPGSTPERALGLDPDAPWS